MQTTDTDPIDQFINQILDEKNLPSVTGEARQQIAEEMRNNLIEQIDRAMINALDSEQLDQLNKMLDQSELSDSQLHQFIIDAGVNVGQLATEVMIKFRSAYLGV